METGKSCPSVDISETTIDVNTKKQLIDQQRPGCFIFLVEEL
jgi:hypothetical protein